jgi:hypothetical protein
MKTKIIFIIRMILTLVMIYFIYKEAGTITAIAFLLIAISLEITVYELKKLKQ